MKKQAYSLVATLGLLITLTVVTAYAQSARMIRANVPFSFVVKDKTLPAGEYSMEPIRVGAAEAIKIQSLDGHITVIVPTRLAQSMTNQENPRLVFNRSGDQYFLAEVLGFEEKAVHRVPRSRIEDELARSEAATKQQVVSVKVQQR